MPVLAKEDTLKALLCSIANRAIKEGPYVDFSTLKYVQKDFLIKAVTEALPELEEKYRILAQGWLDVVNNERSPSQ